MTWLVFAVSGLLVLGGAVSITSGAPIIQLERGWAEVIAGTVAMSSGGVVFALGMILMRLESLRDTLTAVGATRPLVVSDVSQSSMSAAVAGAPAFEPSSAQPPLAPEPPTATNPAQPEPASNETGQGLWKRIKRPPESTEISRLESQGFPDRVAAEPPVAEPAAPAEPAVVTPALQPPVAPQSEAASERDEPRPTEPAETEEAGHLGWLERSLFRSRAGKERGRDGAHQSARVEPGLGDLLGEPARAGGDQAADTHADEAAASPHAVPADEGPTVIGRYQAGVASYVMYSDGTIEVETDSGQSHRFNSMEELKAFIASQEQAGN